MWTGSQGLVVSTKIEKATAERPHFFIAYGTKNRTGLIAFREIEYAALRAHAKSRATAKQNRREIRTRTTDLFAVHEADLQRASIDDIVAQQKALAASELTSVLSRDGPLSFSNAVARLLQVFMLRETNIKDICLDLAKAGAIENTWGSGNRKPRDESIIRLKPSG